jgi:hypothetical protein
MAKPSGRPRILLVRERDFYIHLAQLAQLLSRHGCDVEVLNTTNAEPEPLYRDLVAEVRAAGIPCHLVVGRAAPAASALLAAAFRLRLITKRNVITPFKVRESLKTLSTRSPFDLVIAFDPVSLFLATQLFRSELGRIIEYSLEISDESHIDFQASRAERSFRRFERRMLPKLRALMIQDRFRAAVLLRHVRRADAVRTIYFPVAMAGPGRKPAPGLRTPGAATVMFFGGVWSAAFLRELQAIAAGLRDRQRLVVCGGRGTVTPGPVSSTRFELNTEPIPFDRVNDAIESADIGLALYPHNEPNSRISAFASEKVSRYLQCGVPFIAFRSEDYAFLQAETRCCELVDSYAEVPAAVNRIIDNHASYQRGAVAAFDRFYCHDTTGPALVRALVGE